MMVMLGEGSVGGGIRVTLLTCGFELNVRNVSLRVLLLRGCLAHKGGLPRWRTAESERSGSDGCHARQPGRDATELLAAHQIRIFLVSATVETLSLPSLT